jgi:hypothetical protein
MEIVQDITKLLADGGWVAFAAFGAYLAYKLAFTSVISITVLKLAIRVVNYLQSKRDHDQKLIQIAASAGLSWPMTIEQWEEINRRVKPEQARKAA